MVAMDEHYRLKNEVERRFNSDFNFIPQDNLNRICEYWFEYVLYPDGFEDEDNEILDIMWGTLFEASDNMLAEKIRNNVNELYELGLTVIDLGNSDYADAYDTGVFIGVRGCGYDFYSEHWIPMYKDVFGWVK